MVTPKNPYQSEEGVCQAVRSFELELTNIHLMAWMGFSIRRKEGEAVVNHSFGTLL